MYLSPDDARSDFFLAAAVYVIGPALISLLVRAVPGLFGNAAMAWVLAIGAPILLNAAMPIFLMRYREEPTAVLFGGGAPALARGLGLAAVFAAAVAVGEVLGGGRVAELASSLPLQLVVAIVLQWLTLAVLAIFLHRRAEYAFRPISEPQDVLVRRAGLACVGTAAVATLLLLLTGVPFGAVVAAAGLAGWYLLAERQLPQQGMGERWWVYAPVITLALGPLEIFSFLFAGQDFLASAQQAAVAGLFGLVTAMALHARRGGAVAFGMAAALVVAGLLSLGGGTRFPLVVVDFLVAG